jgi:two-component system sporulation sensor kinase A
LNFDYSQLISSAAVIFVVLDSKGKVTEMNAFALDFFGFKESEIIGKDWFDFCVPDDMRTESKKSYKSIIDGKIEPGRSGRIGVIAKNKKRATISSIYSFIKDTGGSVKYCIGIGYDVTDEVLAEKQRAETVQLMNAIFHTSPQAMLSIDRGFIIRHWNEAAEKVFGYSKKETIGKISPLIPKGSFDAVKKMYAKIFEQGENFSYEGLRKRKDDSSIFVKVYAGPIKNEANEVTGAMVLIEDITARKEEEKTRAYLKFGIEKSDSAIFLTDREGKIIYVNPAFETLYGFSQAEVLGKTSRFFKSSQQSDKEYDERWREIKAGKNIRNEIANMTKSGKEVIVSNSTNPVTDSVGSIIGFIALQHDITEETSKEKQLQELTSLNQQIIDNSPMGIFILDRTGAVEYVNQGMLKISGSPKDKLIGHNLLNNENYIKLGLSAKIMDAIHQGLAFETEPIKYRSLYGKKETYRIFTGNPIHWSNGQFNKIMVTVRDVSELAHHNEELERFNGLMVGREMKMVELKNQIQQLKTRSESPAENRIKPVDAIVVAAAENRARSLHELIENIDNLISNYGKLFSIELPGSGLGFWDKRHLRHLLKGLINKNIECKKNLLTLIEKNERS